MGRTRSNKLTWLPKHVRLHKGRYVYAPYLGCIDGKAKRGKEIVLGREGDSKSKIWQEFEKHQHDTELFTIKWMINEFVASSEYSTLATKTKKEYQKYRSVTEGSPRILE